MSKGSKQRPREISEAEWFANWERVYGKKKDGRKQDGKTKDGKTKESKEKNS